MGTKTIYGSCYNPNNNLTELYQFYAEVKEGQPNTADNYTPVTVGLKVCRNPDYPYANSAYNLTKEITVKLSIDGTEVFSTTTADIDTRNGKVWTFATKTVNVDHNADGSKTMAITASFTGADVSSLDRGTLSGSVELEIIPGASVITSAADTTLGKKCSVKWTPASASFRYRLQFSIGSKSVLTGIIHPNQTSPFVYTGSKIPLSFADQIRDSKTGTVTVTLYTYSDSEASTKVGDADSATFTATVPEESATQPTVTMTLTPVNDLPDAFAGLYIQGKSKVQATISASAKYGASIAKNSMRVDGVTHGEADALTSDYLTKYGDMEVEGLAEDSRGITGSTKEQITVIGYSKPKILAASGETSVVATRCNASGDALGTGTYLKIKAKRDYSPVEADGAQKNFCSIRFRYAAKGGSYSDWETILAEDTTVSDEIITGALLDGALAEQATYLVQVQAIDDIGEENTTTIVVPTETIYCHRTRNAMGLGKYVEGENLLDVAWDAKFRGDVMIGDITLREYILQIMSEGV